MSKSGKKIGVLTHIKPNRHGNSTHYTAWIETPNGEKVFFHQKSLTNQEEINQIQNNNLVLFEVKVTKTEKGEREDAIGCSFNCKNIITKNIFEYNINTIKFIFDYATDELKGKLISKINNVQMESPINDILIKIENIKKELPLIFGTNEQIKNIETHQALPNPTAAENFAPKSFLEAIFAANTPEYNENLFYILVNGLKSIDSEDVFTQAKFLLQFNSTIDNKIENLNSLFYHKANNDYKFRLWFEKLTDYCSTEVLKYHFEQAELALQLGIIQRCQGDENGFLVLNNCIKNPNEIEEVYFSKIRAKLLQELGEAKQSISIAVAWFTNDALFDMLCNKLNQGVAIELIIINDYINNWEFGLPFQTFVDLGGKLYFSEYPNIMHHKFCIIDNEVIFNGSYNWTYYAETRNDENIMLFKGKPNLVQSFLAEFEKLKLKFGNPITKVDCFDNSQVGKFERAAFREYISNDLVLRAKSLEKTNIMDSHNLINAAISIDETNVEAGTFKEQIQTDVELEKRKNLVQKTISEKTTSPIKELNAVCKAQNSNANIEGQKDDNQQNEFIQAPQNKSTSTTPKPYTQSLLEQPAATTHAETKQEPIAKTYSASKNEPIEKQFQNFKIAIALDISGSMANLYNNNTVQQVVEKLLAVALSISYNEQLDIWTFNSNSIRMPSVSKVNFKNYIPNNNIIPNGGTTAINVITDIYKKYFQESIGYNVFAIILTDGDIGNIENFIKNSYINPIFWQFIALGNGIASLNSLNRDNENVSFFTLNDISTISDDSLYNKLLSEFIIWYEKKKNQGLIK